MKEDRGARVEISLRVRTSKRSEFVFSQLNIVLCLSYRETYRDKTRHVIDVSTIFVTSQTKNVTDCSWVDSKVNFTVSVHTWRRICFS